MARTATASVRLPGGIAQAVVLLCVVEMFLAATLALIAGCALLSLSALGVEQRSSALSSVRHAYGLHCRSRY
ncbi:MAG: hypothetical protein ACREU6_08770 [Steroidobacteraceae bacterium]